MLNEAARGDGSVSLLVASHNQDSVVQATRLMSRLGLDPSASPIYFGQLLGMSDYLTFSLASQGFKAYKQVIHCLLLPPSFSLPLSLLLNSINPRNVIKPPHQSNQSNRYVPYGPIMEVVPYLIRRAQENSSIAGGVKVELGLLREEMMARALGPLMDNVSLF